MKTLKLLTGVVLLSTIGAVAQAPAAARRQARPGLALTTSAFEDGGIIPDKYTQSAPEGKPVSPVLTWTNVPDGTVSFALIVRDPDTSVAKTTDEIIHWVAFNIPGTAKGLPENVEAGQATLPDGTIQGLNERKGAGYMGMGAPAAGPYHHYTWYLYALDTKLSLPATATAKDVEAAMDGHILGVGVLEGRFHR